MERLWAPWRSRYVTGLAGEDDEGGGCFLCAARDAGEPARHLVLARGEGAYVIMNRYPYNTGHLMVACNDHCGGVEDVPPETAAEMWRLLLACKAVLTESMNAHGVNIGINQGRCAGAGVADHLHIHIVPRWEGDTNFMPTLGETKVMSQSLDDLYAQLRPVFAERGLAP